MVFMFQIQYCIWRMMDALAIPKALLCFAGASGRWRGTSLKFGGLE
jgi:hypothetical protein